MTATVRRRRSTASAAPTGRRCARRRATRSRRWPPNCSTSTRAARVHAGYPAPPDTRWQRELESSFLYEDTPDQRKATEDVKRDMERPLPMDRLLVGDVGYGKTEVAVRAAFKAVQGGKQVAVLVPTTILAEQHFRTFADRLADYPVTVEALSRFRTAKEQKETVLKLAEGGLDIVIGTHRLLSKDVLFKDLGLVDRRRGASLRREAQGAAQAAAARRRRAHAHRDADSAHAAPVAGRPARHDADRDAAARPLADPHLRRAVGRRAARRGDRARARSRRAGLRGAQPDRDDRDDRRPHPGACPAGHGGGRPRPDGGRRARGRDAAVRGGEGRHPRLHDDRRVGARRAERQHDDRPRRPSFRTGTALPAARARGPVAPPGVLLPDGPGHDRSDGRGTIEGARAPHRAGGRLPDRPQGPGAARGGQPPGLRAVRACARRRVRPLPALARGDGHRHAGAWWGRRAPAAGRGPGRPGAPPGRLYPGRRDQAGPLSPTGAGVGTGRH